MNTDEMDTLFRSVGFIVVQWGLAEQSLDMTTAMLFQVLGGKRHSKHLPKMLDRKLEFLSNCLAKLPVLAPFRADGEALVASFRDLRHKRHDLIHGAIWSLTPKDGAYLFGKLDIRDDYHHVREVRLEATEFQAFTKRLADLLTQATTFAARLWEIVPK